jgi:hypothetical protein
MADLTVTAASVLWTSGTKLSGIAGAAVADAVGVALHAAGSGQPLVYASQGAVINIGATTTKATTYVVSATAGGVAPQADLVSTNKIVRLGYATDAVGGFVVDIRNTGVSVT